MAFDWREYLTLAAWLQVHPLAEISQEASFRCAVSRAYYAAFGHAFHYAKDYLSFAPRHDGDDHGRLRAHLKQKRRQKIAESLDRLRNWRNHCDYESELPGDLSPMLAAAISEAEYVFKGLPPPIQSTISSTTP